MKIINSISLLVVFLFSIHLVNAQNGYLLQKKIRLSFEEIKSEDSLINLELYQNGDFTKKKSSGGKYYQHFSKDGLTNIFTLSYSFSGIGSGSEPNYLKCPELFVKLNFKTKHKGDFRTYFVMIPIIPLVCATTELIEINVLNLDLNPLINQSGKVIIIEENNEYKIIDQSDLETALVMKKLMKIKWDGL